MVHLRRQWSDVLLAEGYILRRQRTRPQAAIAAVIAHAGVVDDGHIVDIGVMNNRLVYACNRTVVLERIVVPVSAHVAHTHVAVAVVHAAIEADVRTPVAVVPSITAAVEAPVSRRP
jgi:hypothetical protein